MGKLLWFYLYQNKQNEYAFNYLFSIVDSKWAIKMIEI